MKKKLLLALALVIVTVLALAAFRSPEMTVAREIIVQADPQVVFSLANHSRKSNEWMPWSEEDPAVQMSYSGPDQGVGSVSSWTSTGKMGVGRAEIVESVPHQLVRTQLTYTKPMVMTQMAEFKITPSDKGTVVRWSVTAHNGYFFRLISIFVNFDKVIGASFEKGLANLKRMAEANASASH